MRRVSVRVVLWEEEAGKCLFCSKWRRSVRVWLAERIFLFLQFFGVVGEEQRKVFLGLQIFFRRPPQFFGLRPLPERQIYVFKKKENI